MVVPWLALRFYVDGTLRTSSNSDSGGYTAMGAGGDTTEALYIAAAAADTNVTGLGSTAYGDMYLAQIVIWQERELIADEVAIVYNGGMPSTMFQFHMQNKLAACWRFGNTTGDAVGSLLIDVSGQGHHMITGPAIHPGYGTPTLTPAHPGSSNDGTTATGIGGDHGIPDHFRTYGDQSENNNCLWWKERAERDSNYLLATKHPAVSSSKAVLHEVITNHRTGTAPLFTINNQTVYQGSTYALRRLTKPYRLEIEKSMHLHGGLNLPSNQKYDAVLNSVSRHHDTKWGVTGRTAWFGIHTGNIEAMPNCQDDMVLANQLVEDYDALGRPVPPEADVADNYNHRAPVKDFHVKRRKEHVPFHVTFGTTRYGDRLYADGVASEHTSFDDSISAKGHFLAPFNLLSASYYNSTNLPAAEIINLNHDLYGPHYETPMQGPFAERYVGGYQYRHSDINSSGTRGVNKTTKNNLDTAVDRPEAYVIMHGSDYPGIQLVPPHVNTPAVGGNRNPARAVYSREEYAKRPLNIRNILLTSSFDKNGAGPSYLGNYRYNYEIVNIPGRNVNNLWFRSGTTGDGGWSQPTSPESTAVSGLIDFELPQREYLHSSFV